MMFADWPSWGSVRRHNTFPSAATPPLHVWRRGGLALLSLLFATTGFAYEAVVSTQPNRSGAVPLHGSAVSGDAYVFVVPETGVSRVDFHIDNPAATGTPYLIERRAPFDLNGTAPNGDAFPFDTTSLADGVHDLTIVVSTSAGKQTITSTFSVANDAPALVFDPISLVVSREVGAPAVTLPVNLAASDGSSAAFSTNTLMPWLSVEPSSGSTLPASLAVTADPSTLAAGTYTGTVTASAAGYTLATLTVKMVVMEPGSSAYSLMVSDSPDRAAPVVLHGATLDSLAYIFTLPETGVTKVEFFIDNPTLGGTPVKVENSPPFDLGGTASNGQAMPFDTNQLADGSHTLSARVTSGSGVETTHANFTVANDATQGALTAAPASLSLSAAVGGAPVSEAVTLSTSGTPGAGFTAATTAAWLSVSPSSGTTPQSVTVTANPASLTAGTHSAAVNFTAPDHSPVTVPVSFTVSSPGGLSLIATPNAATVSTSAGGSPEQVFVDVATSNGAAASISTASNQPWLTVQPTSAQTPAQLTLTVDPATLAAGSYSGTVTVTASGYSPATVNVDVAVGGSGGCFPVACAQIKVQKPYVLDFSEDHGFLEDSAGVGTGFTYVDWPSNGNGYLPINLTVNPVQTTLEITTTSGIAFTTVDSQDNAIGVGIDAASHNSVISTEVRNVPAGTGNYEQAGLWFGVDEDNYVKLVVMSRPQGPAVQYYLEVGGKKIKEVNKPVGNLVGADVVLELSTSPTTRKIFGRYSVNGGTSQLVDTFDIPPEFFSFDGAGIDPIIGTRSFAGIFATHRNGPNPLVYSFDEFSVVDGAELPQNDTLVFDRVSHTVPMPTNLAWAPDDRLYVTEMFGRIHALTYDANLNVIDDQIITALNDSLGNRLTLGITVDPSSTAANVILWVAHSSPSLNNGTPNSSTVTRLSGPGFSQVAHVITGLPRAIANHAINSLHFGPDGRLYIAQGGNTGAGAPNTSSSEFGQMEEQPLSAAILVANVYAPGFDGSCNNASDIFGPPPCDVVPYATGLRNAYDFVFHTNGQLYAADNGLGVTGTFPPSPTPPCFGFASTASWTNGGHNPGSQPDVLHRIQQGKYYGHPNPYRNECVFMNGSYQAAAPLPNYVPPIHNLGNNRSANGIVEYLSDRACGALQGDLLIANYSVGDDLTRVRLSPDGFTVASSESMVSGFSDPLPLATNAAGVIFVGELGGNRVTALRPANAGCWTNEPPLPAARLDGSAAAIGTNIYFVGGKSGTTYFPSLFIFNTLSSSWLQGANHAPIAVENPAVATVNGKLYVFGGSTDPFSNAVASASMYDPATNSWSNLAPMPTARGGAAAVALGGVIYVVGGMTTNGASTDIVEIYNPQTNTWATGVPMTTRRDNLGVAALGGQLYAFGGRTRNADGTVPNGTLSSVEVFNPSTGGAWQPRAAMPTGRRAFALGTIGGKVQIFGGENAPSGDNVFEAGEEYDPATNSWRAITPMTRGRHGPGSATVGDRVYVMGGNVQAGSAATTTHESFAY